MRNPDITIKSGILMFIEDHAGEVRGTEELALAMSTINCKAYVIRYARALQRDGEITILPSRGGRGRKTIYKRNQNQAGLARRRAR